MLHRSFKPAKCKTSLKLATSRIKLLRNKKGVQINQIKKELAQLLESGQDRTARIRVEHVIREEKMVAAYELLEIYCELIAARLPIVESQKNCPIDLKEAITSVVFASPRCADLPELQDVRKQFTAKYGKEFISAAIELWPDCGVSRMLIEKLSAAPPDLQTKIKVLSAVAREHNVTWDANSFQENESKPPDDLLNGPNTFEKASNMHAHAPNFQAPNVQHGPSHEEKHEVSFDPSQHNRIPSVSSQNFASTGSAGIGTSSTTHKDVWPSAGRVPELREGRASVPRDDNFSSDRQNWNLGFKDATSAAQAAAESAERASMAARAAAELSRQHSNESQRSSVRDEGPRDSRQYLAASQRSNVRDEGPREARQYSTASQRSNRDEEDQEARQHSTSSRRSSARNEGPQEYQAARHSRDSYNSFSGRKPDVRNQETDNSDNDALQKTAESFYEHCRSASLRSNIGSVDDDGVVNSFQRFGKFSKKSSFEEAVIDEDEAPFSPERSMKKDFRETKTDLLKSGQKGSFNNYFGEEDTRKHSRINSSTSDDELDVSISDQRKSGKTTISDPFIGVGQGNSSTETKRASSVIVVDDDDDSDDDGPRFDMGPTYDEGEASSYFPSPGRESLHLPLESTNIWSSRDKQSNAFEKLGSRIFLSPEKHSVSEYSMDSLEKDSHTPVTFDHSDGPDSESEIDPEKDIISGTEQFSSFPQKYDLYSTDLDSVEFESHDMRGSSYSEKTKLESDIIAESRSSFGYTKNNEKNEQATTSEPSKKFHIRKSRIELTDLVDYNSTVDEEKSQLSEQSSRLPLRNKFKDNNVVQSQLPDTLEDDEVLIQPNISESGNGLNFGPLIGGLRNKGYKHPPYARLSNTSTSPPEMKENPTAVSQTLTSSKISSDSRPGRMGNKKPSGFLNASSDSDSDDFGEKFIQTSSKQVKTRSKFEPPVSFLNDDGSDSEDDVPKQTSTPPSNRARLGAGLSRRTKAPPPPPPISKARNESETKLVNTTSETVDRKTSKFSHGDESKTPTKPQRQTGRFSEETFNPITESKISSSREETRKSRAEPGSFKQEARPYLGSLKQEPQAHTSSRRQEAPKPNQESKITMREESMKSQPVEQPKNRPSHVHPKLPDYESVAARLQAIRDNRR